LKEGSSERVHELVNELEEELEKHHDKEEGKAISEAINTVQTDEASENKEAMGLLKNYFSGPEGLKRSVSFIKFADILQNSEDNGQSMAQSFV
jgi:hypothetical protein